jgi:hypothetical protein
MHTLCRSTCERRHHMCGDDMPLAGCDFAQSYMDMIKVVAGLGNPKIFLMIPPPLMKQGAGYGMNETVINTVLPSLIPRIAAESTAAGIKVGMIDVYVALSHCVCVCVGVWVCVCGGGDKNSE